MPIIAIVSSLVLAAMVAVLDEFTGNQIPLALFYLVPIVLAVWYGAHYAGIAFALICAGASLFAHLFISETSITSVDYINTSLQFVIYAAVGISFSLLLSALRRETTLAYTDAITKGPNLRAMEAAAASEIQRAQRTNHPLTVAYIDIDSFKDINDVYGHKTGDGLLKMVAEAQEDLVRGMDLLARVGGDEFVLLMPETEAKGAVIAVTNLRKSLLERIKERGFTLSFSIGIVTFLHPPSDPGELIGMADKVMYTVKENQRGQIRHEVVEDVASDEVSE